MMRTTIWLGTTFALARAVTASEVTVQNDSLVNNGTGVISAGFVAGEKAASWLHSPCDGNIVAVQVLWLSQTSTTGQSLQESIEIFRAGTFPQPGAVAQTIAGPVMTDGVINEFRYLDDNSTIPLIVPVMQDETFVVAFTFADPPAASGPSVVHDSNGIVANANAIDADLGGGNFTWFSNTTLGVNGDWVIRAVVDCPAVPTAADVSTTMSASPPQYTAGSTLQYTITIANAGPASAPGTTVVDVFPSAYLTPVWTCIGSGGASCVPSGTGNIAGAASLPSGSQVVYTVTGTVAAGTTGALSNSATAVVTSPATDPDTTNNTANLAVDPAVSDLIFANGFEAAPGIFRIAPSHASAYIGH